MFKFDRILQPEDSQVDTFKASSESLLKMALQGKNTCAFTYGASGSGKTYTIMGGQGDQAGVLPRTVSALFNCLDEKLGTVILYTVYLRSGKLEFLDFSGTRRPVLMFKQ